MRFTLIDVYIAFWIFGGLLYAAHACLPVNATIATELAIIGGVPLYLLITSPLYRVLHWSPLRFPDCPACHEKYSLYESVQFAWPMECLECSECHCRVEMCHDPRKCQWSGNDVPRFELLWPYSFGGRWRRVDDLQSRPRPTTESKPDAEDASHLT